MAQVLHNDHPISNAMPLGLIEVTKVTFTNSLGLTRPLGRYITVKFVDSEVSRAVVQVQEDHHATLKQHNTQNSLTKTESNH